MAGNPLGVASVLQRQPLLSDGTGTGAAPAPTAAGVGDVKRQFGAVAAAVALAALASGCTSGGGTGSTSDAASGAPSASPSSAAATPGSVAATPAGGASGAASADAAAWAAWGLKPLRPAPAPPVDKPIRLSAHGTVPVISNVPVKGKVVFVTLDDGLEKDPKFVAMMRQLRVPFTMFLTEDIIRDDYAYFRPLQALGNSIQNHTVSHPAMNTLGEDAQRQQVCQDQQVLTKEYGTAPFLFRPPYGAGADTSSLNEAVQACGPRAIILWRETMQVTGMQYQDAGKKLHPGDIILAHFRGPAELHGESMTKMFANLLKRIEEQGYTVGRLDDYIAKPTS